MAYHVEKALEDLEGSVDQEAFFQTSFVFLKILQNIVLNPDDDKYRRIRRASKLLTQKGAAHTLRAIGFEEQGDHFVFHGDGDAARRVKDVVGAFRRRRHEEIGAWEIPTSALAFNERVGKGKYGEVYKGSWDGSVVAIKTLRPKCDDFAVEQFKKEAGIMRKCKHRNVLSLLAVCLYVEPSYIVLELMQCCYLEILREETLSNKEILDGMTQVAAGLEYLHHVNIIHCDLAARNVLVDSIRMLKISDFGLARIDGSPECNAAGLPGAFPTRWTSPEVFTNGILSKKSDVWSFGVMFYEFTTAGAVPYAEFTNKETKAKVLEGYRLPQPPDCPNQFYTIQQKCWAAKPSSRPSLQDISQDLMLFKVQIAQTRKVSISVKSTDSDESSPSPQPSVSDALQPVVMFPTENVTPNTLRRFSSGLTKKGKNRKAGLKVEKLLCVYTMAVSPLHSRVVIGIKRKHKAIDVVSTVLKKVNKEKTDPSMCALVEVFEPEEEGGQREMRYLKDKEQPLVVRANWAKKGRFFLCNRVVGSDTLLEMLRSYLNQPDNVALTQYKTRGYLIKFDEKVGGMKGRNLSRNWIRYWTLLDGSSMLFYRDEEDEEEDGEPLFHLSIKDCQVEPATDYTKKRGVFRVITVSEDQYLFHASNKEDLCRWLEAIYSSRVDEASPILDKFGSGEVLKAGFLTVTRHGLPPNSSYDEFGREWFVLKDQHLSYFHHGERLIALDFSLVTKVVVRSPTIVRSYDDRRESSSSLLNFAVEVLTEDSRYVLKPDTPGEQEEWLAAMEKALVTVGKTEVISLTDSDEVTSESATVDSTTPNYMSYRPQLPRLSEERERTSESDAASPAGESRPSSVASGGGAESVTMRIKKQLSQRRGGGYVVRSRFLKEGLDEMGVYEGDDADRKVAPKVIPEESLAADDLPPPPPPLELAASDDVPTDSDFPPPPDDLPPPPEDFEVPALLDSPPPLVRRNTKPKRLEPMSNYMNMSPQPSQPSDEYLEMHDFAPDPSRRRKPDGDYVAMSRSTMPIDIDKNGGNYIQMSRRVETSGPGRPLKVSPVAARRSSNTHSRQSSDDIMPGVLLSTSPGSWHPSPNQSPATTRSRRVATGDAVSYSSTPSSSTPSTPHSVPTADNSLKSPKRDLFTAPRRTIPVVTTESGTPTRDRELPPPPGAGYLNTYQRQVSEPPISRSNTGMARQLSPATSSGHMRTASAASIDFYRSRSDSAASQTSVCSVLSLKGSRPAQPLPAGWRSKFSDKGKMYYYHSATQQRTWKIEEVWESAKGWDRRHTSLAPGWMAAFTSEGQTYYYNKDTKATSWNVEHTWTSTTLV